MCSRTAERSAAVCLSTKADDASPRQVWRPPSGIDLRVPPVEVVPGKCETERYRNVARGGAFSRSASRGAS